MRLKQVTALTMGTMLVFASLPLSAYAKDADTEAGKYSKKDEAIYGNLATDGTPEDMYVVNTFHIKKPGTMTDHGDYSDVRNLSNLADMKQTDDDKVKFQAKKKGDDFYYQGDLNNKPLPWQIKITYKLDGKKIDPDKLAGKHGKLELQIKTKKNKDVDQTFFKNYMLQVSVKLDPDKVGDIQAPDGTKAKAGKDTQVTFTGMPKKEDTFILIGKAKKFEMDPIEINATPASMSIDDPDLGDMKGSMKSLSDAVKKIDDGVGDLNNGIADLNDGSSKLSKGSSDYQKGINQLDQKSDQLVDGSAKINDVLKQVKSAVKQAPDDMPDISDLKQLPDGLHKLADNLHDTADGIDDLRKNYADGYDHLADALEAIPDDELDNEQLQKILDDDDLSDADKKTIKSLTKAYKAAQKAKGTYQNVKDAFTGVTDTLDDVSKSLHTMADNADDTAKDLKKGMKNLDGLDQLDDFQSGIEKIASQYQTFHQGLIDYTNGVGKLATNYQDIDSGIQGLDDGASSLKSGSADLKKGTHKLHKKTGDLPGETQSKVDDMLDEYDGSDFDPVSFVSDKNKHVDLVQFSLKTKKIEVDEPDDKDTDKKDEKEGFWQRLLDLFR